MADQTHILQIFFCDAQETMANTGLMDFYADKISVRRCGGHSDKAIAIAKANFEVQRRPGIEYLVNVEGRI
jgi:hypothetical protein